MFDDQDHELINDLEEGALNIDEPTEQVRLGKLLRKIVHWIESEDTRAMEAGEY